MKLALLGLTGRTGGEVARLALSRGHEVRALARNPAAVPHRPSPSLVIVPGDARDPAAVDALVAGCDAVVIALGPARRSFVVAQASTANVIRAMRAHGLKTLVVLSGAAMRMPGDRPSLRHRLLIALGRVLAAPIVRDKEAEVALLRATDDLDWVLVRPPRLTRARGRGDYRASATELAATHIARADLARFMLDQAETPTFARQAPFVSA
ncbi:MAG: NAD(P)H-binding protein [Myxococcota bacterium]